MHYFRPALRKLLKTPGFTLLAIFTLAIGIGANTTIFSVVDAVLIEPLPYPDSGRLTEVSHSAPGLDFDNLGQCDAAFLRHRELNESFEDIAMYEDRSVTLTGVDTPQRLRGLSVTPSFFGILQVLPSLGREFSEAAGRPGAQPVAILSDGLWRQRLGGSTETLGTTVRLDGVEHEIVGIMPPGFGFPDSGVDIYVPKIVDPSNAQLGSFSANGLGRLKPDVTLEQATTDLNRLLANLEQTFPEDSAATVLSNANFQARITSLHESIVGDVRVLLWILLGTVAFVLLIACANVANLFLARSEGRQRESAVRAALGATKTDLIAGSLAESLLLGLAASGLAMLLSYGGISLLMRFGPQDTPRLDELGIDASALLFNLVIAVATSLLFGLIPAWRTAFLQLTSNLKDGSRSMTAGRDRHRTRHLLVATQVALALVLLIGSGLMLRSFVNLAQINLGFNPTNTLTFRLALPESSYADDQSAARFFESLVERLEALPGVEHAAAVRGVPLGNNFSAGGHFFEHVQLQENAPPPILQVQYATPGTFDALGIPLLQGRDFADNGTTSRSRSVIISRSVAEQYWPGQSPVGKRIANSRPGDDEDLWYTVIGVAGDLRFRQLQEEPPKTVYYPLLGNKENDHVAQTMSMVIRTQGNPDQLRSAIRPEVWALDPDLPIAEITTLEALVKTARAPMAFTVLLLMIAATVALILGSVGTYGVISYLVSQRTPEIGVRMALGASTGSVRTMVLRQAFAVAGAGVVAGLVGALALTRWLDSLLFEVSPLDPLTFALVPTTLILVALMASWLPARRAAKVDPMVALRHD